MLNDCYSNQNPLQNYYKKFECASFLAENFSLSLLKCDFSAKKIGVR